ncbi:hypothetical protein HDU83_004924 [Entophlyctis luteolus]|nr:hypothetical protein HDU83_004924 [Entophlyctis luteolus]
MSSFGFGGGSSSSWRSNHAFASGSASSSAHAADADADADMAASLLESQNNDSVDSLHAKIKAIKGISINLHDNVNEQNHEMSDTFNQVGDGLKSSSRRLQAMLSTPHGQQTCTIALLIVLLLISIWVLWAKWSKK